MQSPLDVAQGPCCQQGRRLVEYDTRCARPAGTFSTTYLVEPHSCSLPGHAYLNVKLPGEGLPSAKGCIPIYDVCVSSLYVISSTPLARYAPSRLQTLASHTHHHSTIRPAGHCHFTVLRIRTTHCARSCTALPLCPGPTKAPQQRPPCQAEAWAHPRAASTSCAPSCITLHVNQ